MFMAIIQYTRSFLLKVFCIFFFSFSFCFNATAAVFMVTSTADAGAGTLREALQKANDNGPATMDVIVFNLEGATVFERTIFLESGLPEAGSVMIDGTTQSGSSFGVSDAKVAIRPIFGRYFNCLTINGDAEVYGLMISGFQLSAFQWGDGIHISEKCLAIIGAPGKGNVITGNTNGISGQIGDSKIQSNFIGVNENGTSVLGNAFGITGRPGIEYINNAMIGGDNLEQGNVISGNKVGLNFDSNGGASSETVYVINNSFGTDYTGNVELSVGEAFIYTRLEIQIVVKNNVFAASTQAINVTNRSYVMILGNYFGTTRIQDRPLGRSNNEAINGNGNCTFIIGGENAADQNVFANYANPFFLINSAKAKVVKNTFYCNEVVNTIPGVFDPDFKILTFTPNKLAGIAPAGASIQLYSTEADCGNCNPKERFATIIADGSGEWVYNGLLTGPVMASSTIGDKTTGFEPKIIHKEEVTIQDYTCHQKGAIEINLKKAGDFYFAWKNESGEVLSTAQSVKDIEPGTYTLEYSMKGGCTYSNTFTVRDLRPRATPQALIIPCNETEIEVYGDYNSMVTDLPDGYFWENSAGEVIGNGPRMNLRPGKYFFYIQDKSGCLSNKAEVNVISAVEAPLINESNTVIIHATCNVNGSISGITASTLDNGPITYKWLDTNGNEVSTSKDLINAGAGVYTLSVYNTNMECPASSSPMEIKQINGITVDESHIMISPANCDQSNGIIRNILTDATQFSWFNEANQRVSTAIDLKNAAPGFYTLQLSNRYNCTKMLGPFEIIASAPKVYDLISEHVTALTCAEDNGTIQVKFSNFDNTDSYRWQKPDGSPLIATESKIENLSAGIYKLFLREENGCEQFFKNYEVRPGNPAIAILTQPRIIPDICHSGKGSITGITHNMAHADIVYTWFDATGKVVANSLDLIKGFSGNHRLLIKDDFCEKYFDYYIPDTDVALTAPIVPDQFVCSQTEILIHFKEDADAFKIYHEDGSLFVESSSKTIRLKVKETGKWFAARVMGNCESSRREFSVTVGGSSSIKIPTAFSPNDDGINDQWNIIGFEQYPSPEVEIFNRYGASVYHSIGYTSPFEGKRNGNLLPAGVYFYMIKLTNECAPLSGSLTLIR